MPKQPKILPPTRSAGVLLHVTSLPNEFGIGDLGPAAHRWVDTLAATGQTWWQILPLNPPDGSDSPYSASSSRAGNALLVSPESLARNGLLTRRELSAMKTRAGDRVDFRTVRAAKRRMFELVTPRVDDMLRDELDVFTHAQSAWLDDYALFAALRERSPNVPWNAWPRAIVRREAKALYALRHELAADVGRIRVEQFLFDRQMHALREHTRRRGVRILGDVPIYLSLDSADCWADRPFFQLDARGRPTAVAGVPPDMFSADGQRWGNPLYDWDALAADGFTWWIDRIRAALQHADVVRIDHFRGLAAYWRIPATSRTAKRGKWVPAPGDAMIRAIRDAIGGTPLVAEDLGVITPDVEKLRDDWNLAGMLILQFGFGGDASNTNLPHHARPNQIVYPGTHDNDTCVGWFKSLARAKRRHVESYAPGTAKDPAGTLIRLAHASVAERAIVQAQDVLGLDSRSRINMPGSTGKKNWTWRMRESALRDRAWKRLAESTALYGRAPATSVA